MNKGKQRSYIGHSFQYAGAMSIKIQDGKALGLKAVLMENSSGLSMTVLQDRCLDIYSLKICGKSIAFLSKAGVIHPLYYDARGHEWLRSFGAGFLTTCGLTQVGEPCSMDGVDLGMHGCLSNTSAEKVTIEDTDDEIIVSGRVHQYKFQFEDIALYRSIHLNKKDNKLKIYNKVVNEGWRATPFMVLFHFNFGYPFLNPQMSIKLPDADIEGWDAYSSSVKNEHKEVTEPDAEYIEQTFIHKLKGDRNGVSFSLADRKNEPCTRVRFEYDASYLPYITQWKYLKPGEYVMAIEPCNNHVKGRKWEKNNGSLEFLEPGETREMDFTITFD